MDQTASNAIGLTKAIFALPAALIQVAIEAFNSVNPELKHTSAHFLPISETGHSAESFRIGPHTPR
jgi:hypothetical protein